MSVAMGFSGSAGKGGAAPARAARLSMHFVAGLELARRFKWLSPPPELEGRSFAITIEDFWAALQRFRGGVEGGAFRPDMAWRARRAGTGGNDGGPAELDARRHR